jgi:hypothetical protein
VHVEVRVTRGAARSIELLANGAVIATMAPPFATSWDTSAVPEGTYALVARVRSRCHGRHESAPRVVVVDRTPPTVVARTPDPDASNVWSRDPISVTFDEPIDPGSVARAAPALELTRDDLSGTGTSTRLALGAPRLSEGDRTLTVAPTAVPQGPCALSLALPGTLADLAGNRIAPTRWSWTVPEWQDLGAPWNAPGVMPAPAIALSRDGRPAVAANLCAGPCTVGLSEWTGPGGWSARIEEAGGKAPLYQPPSVDFDANGRPAYAWEGASSFFHGRWDGSSFVVAKTPISGLQYTILPALRVDVAGNQVMTFVDWNPTRERYETFSRLWEGRWIPFDGPLFTSSEGAAAVDASLDARGNARFVWSGSTTGLLAATLSAGTGEWILGADEALPSNVPPGVSAFRVDPWGRTVYFLATDSADDGYSLTVHAASCPASTCQEEVLGAGVGESALNLDPTQSVGRASMALDPGGAPVVAWLEAHRLYVKRWDPEAGAWKLLGAEGSRADSTQNALPSIAVSTEGILAVAYLERSGSGDQVRVKRYNGSWARTTPGR